MCTHIWAASSSNVRHGITCLHPICYILSFNHSMQMPVSTLTKTMTDSYLILSDSLYKLFSHFTWNYTAFNYYSDTKTVTNFTEQSLRNLTVDQMVSKFPVFYLTQKFNTTQLAIRCQNDFNV
jgi:hypothetical protein